MQAEEVCDHWSCLARNAQGGEGNGNPLQYSCLEKSTDRESGGLKSMGLHDWACVHEGGGRWVGSNKLVELKKKKEMFKEILQDEIKVY